MDLEQLKQTIGYGFRHEELLLRALTHASHSAVHNERLEFLGDSVLNCAVALELYDKFPQLTEGELSRLRASLVSQPSLAATAAAHDLGTHLRLGEGERKSGGARRPSVLADALEALIGAAFIDGGFDAARAIVRRLFGASLADIDPATTGKDPKTLLQEYLHSRRLALPRYSIVATRGEAHELVFEVECEIAALGICAHGEGSSRRSAEQAAAHTAYERAIRT
jgi:ribonuclease-3